MKRTNRMFAVVGAILSLAVALPAVAAAKHGADDRAGHVRGGHGADDGPGHVRHGADDGPNHR
ncbi:MAG: hypothetical protein QOF43_230 [Gaiellaceae bacterium]|nr:hypothetical protein [Gaiellaceae bacterium]